MRDFIIGSPRLQTQYLTPSNFSEPRRDEFAVRLSPPAESTSLPVPFNAGKPSGRVSSLRSPVRDSRVEKSPYMRRSSRTEIPPLIGLAEQSTLVDSLAPYENMEQPKQDTTSVPSRQIPLLPPTPATAPLCQDCPRIDLVALVREKKKAKRLQKKKLRRATPQGLDPQKTR